MIELTRSQVKSGPISKPPMFPLMLSLSRDNSIPFFPPFWKMWSLRPDGNVQIITGC
jgi:hypothetical protein